MLIRLRIEAAHPRAIFIRHGKEQESLDPAFFFYRIYIGNGGAKLSPFLLHRLLGELCSILLGRFLSAFAESAAVHQPLRSGGAVTGCLPEKFHRRCCGKGHADIVFAQSNHRLFCRSLPGRRRFGFPLYCRRLCFLRMGLRLRWTRLPDQLQAGKECARFRLQDPVDSAVVQRKEKDRLPPGRQHKAGKKPVLCGKSRRTRRDRRMTGNFLLRKLDCALSMQRFQKLRILHRRQPQHAQELFLGIKVSPRLHKEQNRPRSFQRLCQGIKQLFGCIEPLRLNPFCTVAGKKRKDLFLGSGAGGYLIGIERKYLQTHTIHLF